MDLNSVPIVGAWSVGCSPKDDFKCVDCPEHCASIWNGSICNKNNADDDQYGPVSISDTGLFEVNNIDKAMVQSFSIGFRTRSEDVVLATLDNSTTLEVGVAL